MVEYMVLSNGHNAMQDPDSLQDELNRLSQDEDWTVVCYCPQGLILERLLPDKGEELAEDILRRQYTLSLPVE